MIYRFLKRLTCEKFNTHIAKHDGIGNIAYCQADFDYIFFFNKDIFFVLTLLLLLASRTYDCTVRSVKLHNSYGACYILPLVDVK